MTVYTIEHAYLLWECIAIPAHNEWLASEAAKNKAGRR